MLRPRVRIVPHDDLLIACDLSERKDADHVAGVHRPSVALAALTVRRPVATALDVGTGNGVQALLASRHAERVVGTDINERALAFAEFSAALNSVTNIEFRPGSFFEPVEGERFDLVVSNPPYVISPETALIFRDSGKPGDSVSADLVAELPRHLAEGGFGSAMISWIAGDDPTERPRAWLDSSGCDAWVIHTGTDDALATAAAWNRAAATEVEGYAERIDAWLAYYERLGIGAIAYGTVVVRRRSGGGNWVRTAELPADRLNDASEHLQRMFAAHDQLDSVLDTPLVLVDDAPGRPHRPTRGQRVEVRLGRGPARVRHRLWRQPRPVRRAPDRRLRRQRAAARPPRAARGGTRCAGGRVHRLRRAARAPPRRARNRAAGVATRRTASRCRCALPRRAPRRRDGRASACPARGRGTTRHRSSP